MIPPHAAILMVLAASAGPPSSLEDMDRVRLRVVTQGAVCPQPSKPCTLAGGPFKPNELSFDAPRRFDFDRGEDRSQAFHAVILQSAALCGIDEARRLRVQERFPDRKVFVHRYFCEDFGDKVTYTNVDRKQGFIAVYAGANENAAKAFLETVRASGEYPGANLRRMQVVVTWQLE
jgi:hypothetical protein